MRNLRFGKDSYTEIVSLVSEVAPDQEPTKKLEDRFVMVVRLP